MFQAVISETVPRYGEPEVVTTFDITPVMNVIEELSHIARQVNADPRRYSQTAQVMAHLVGMIEMVVAR